MAPRPGSSAADHPRIRPRRPYARRLPPEERREQLLDAALEVILELGYSGVSIEAVARRAGVTRPVVYDHFPNLSRLLSALIEREERYSVEALAEAVPVDVAEGSPSEVLAAGVRRFLDTVASRPATWRIILLPLEGTPTIVRAHVERNRALTLNRIEQMVQSALEQHELPDELDVELTARAIRDLGEEAGRMVLTDPEQYPPARYEQFVQMVVGLMLPAGAAP